MFVYPSFPFRKNPQFDQVHTVVCQGCLGVGPAVGETERTNHQTGESGDRIPGPTWSHDKKLLPISSKGVKFQPPGLFLVVWGAQNSECWRIQVITFYWISGQIIGTSHDRFSPKWWFSMGNPLISGKPRLVKYYNLARLNPGCLIGIPINNGSIINPITKGSTTPYIT